MVMKIPATEWVKISASPPRYQCFHLSSVTGRTVRKGHRIVTSASGESKAARPATAPQDENVHDLYSKRPTRVFVIRKLTPDKLCPSKPYLGFGQSFRNWRMETENPPTISKPDDTDRACTSSKIKTSCDKYAKEITDYGYLGTSPNHLFGLVADPRPISYVADFLWKTERGMKPNGWKDKNTLLQQPTQSSRRAAKAAEHLIIQMADELDVGPDDLVNGVLDHCYMLHPGNDMREILRSFSEFEPTSGLTGILQEMFVEFGSNIEKHRMDMGGKYNVKDIPYVFEKEGKTMDGEEKQSMNISNVDAILECNGKTIDKIAATVADDQTAEDDIEKISVLAVWLVTHKYNTRE